MANQGPQPKMPDPRFDSGLTARAVIKGGYGLEKILAHGQDTSGH